MGKNKKKPVQEYIQPNADELLGDLISLDMSRIWHEVGGQDGMYENFPISRIYRDGESTRCYALGGYGGVAIISSNSDEHDFKIVTLGEDDGYHFLSGCEKYCSYYGNKTGFMELLSLALSIFNNNIK